MSPSEKKTLEMKEMDAIHSADADLDEGKIVPPDGGWGWVVMVASFLCNVIIDGIIFSFGLVITDLSIAFGEPVSQVAWVGSLLSGFYLIAGPFVSGLSNRFGFRVVVIAGSVVASLSFLAAFFATSTVYLLITVGFIGGISFGLVYVPAVVAVGFYFDKKRALATGVAVCGSGIGAFVFAPLTNWLIEIYGWRGTLLIHAGLVFQCAVFGSLFRPLEPVKKKRQRANAKVTEVEGTPLMVRIKRSRDEKLQSDIANSTGNLSDKRSSLHSSVSAKLDEVKQTISSLTDSTTLKSKNKEDEMETEALMSSEKQPNVAKLSETKEKAPKQSLVTTLQLNMFLSPSFVVICISSFLTFLGYFVPFLYTAARAENAGIDNETASFLLSIIGICNTIGRVAVGGLADHPKVSVLLVNNIAITICGAVSILSPLFPSYEMLVVYCCLLGLSMSPITAIRSVLLVELLGLDYLTNSYGFMLVFMGLAAIVGGPMAGFFYDVTGNYDATYYISGSLVLVSGILCYPLGYLNRWEKRRKAKKNQSAVGSVPTKA